MYPYQQGKLKQTKIMQHKITVYSYGKNMNMVIQQMGTESTTCKAWTRTGKINSEIKMTRTNVLFIIKTHKPPKQYKVIGNTDRYWNIYKTASDKDSLRSAPVGVFSYI